MPRAGRFDPVKHDGRMNGCRLSWHDPARLVTFREGADRTFSDAILVYAAEQGMSLDWWWMGDARGLVMANHYRERQAPAA